MATNLASTTRPIWEATRQSQVLMQIPVLNALMKRRRVVWKGGTVIKKTIPIATMESLGQEYSMGEALTSTTKTMYDLPEFNWKYGTLPVEYDADVEIQNASNTDGKIIDLAKDLVTHAQQGAKQVIRTAIFGAYSATSDSQKGFQGFADALAHDSTLYGGITRSTTSKTWWMGASIAGTWADYSTATACNIHNIRELTRVSSYYRDRKPSDILIVVSPTNFNKLRREMETRMIYRTDGDLAKQGFTAMSLDGMEIVADPYLDTNSTTQAYVYLLHLPDWEFRIHPSRDFAQTDFVWQGQIVNGYDRYLSRIMWAGNLVCWQPNASGYLSSMS